MNKEFKEDKSLVIGIPESHGGPQLTFALNHNKGSYLLRIKGVFGHFLKDCVTFIESLGVTTVKLQIADLDGEESYYQSSWKKDKRKIIPRFLSKAEEEGWLYGEFIIKVYFLRARKKAISDSSAGERITVSPYKGYTDSYQSSKVRYRERKLSKLARREESESEQERTLNKKEMTVEEIEGTQSRIELPEIGKDLDKNEELIVKEIMLRSKKKAQSNHLKKSTGLEQDLIRKILRNLVEKGVLKVTSGWYMVREGGDAINNSSSKANSSSVKTKIVNHAKAEKREKQAVKAEGSRELIKEFKDLDKNENIVLNAILHRPRQKAQSNLLKKQLDMDQEDIKAILRILVKKGYLKIVSGWYSIHPAILEANPSLQRIEKEKEKASSFDIQDKVSTSNLTDIQKKILNAILLREKKKAQSNLLKKVLKLDQDTIKQNLRELVKGGFLTITSGWYIAKKELYETIPPEGDEEGSSLIDRKARILTPRDIRILNKNDRIFVLYKNKKLPYAKNFIDTQVSSLMKSKHPIMDSEYLTEEQIAKYLLFIGESIRYLILKKLSEDAGLDIAPPRFIKPKTEKEVARFYPNYQTDVETGVELFKDFYAKNNVHVERTDLILLSEKNRYFSWLDFVGTVNGETCAMNFIISFAPLQKTAKGFALTESDRLLGSAVKEAMKENSFGIDKFCFLQICPQIIDEDIVDLENYYHLTFLRKNKFRSFLKKLKAYDQKIVKKQQSSRKNDQFPAIVDVVREVVELRELSKIGKIADEGEGMFDPLETFNYLTVREQYIRYGVLKDLARTMKCKEPKLVFSCESEEDYFHTIKDEPDLYEDYRNGLKIYRKFIREYEVHPLKINIPVKSKRYKYSGILDMVAQIGEKVIAVKISTMTGNVADEDRMAGAAYFQAAKETLPDMEIEKMGWLQIAPELLYSADDSFSTTKPYSFTLFQNRRNKLDDFLKLLRKFRSGKSGKRKKGKKK